MTRGLVALFVALQAADFATYALVPEYEANPAMRALPVAGVAIAKAAGVVAALGIVSAIRTPSLQAVALGLGIAIGALGVGANLATLSIVAAAEAPRPAREPAPIGDEPTGYEQGHVPAAPGRAAAPRAGAAPSPIPSPATGTGAARVAEAPDPDPSGDSTRGTASWYPAAGLQAAAGPALRALLGRGWRGETVRVSAGGRSVVVRLLDWCGCHRGTRRERIIDLSDDAFVRLAPLSAGLVRVRVEALDVRPPETATR